MASKGSVTAKGLVVKGFAAKDSAAWDSATKDGMVGGAGWSEGTG